MRAESKVVDKDFRIVFLHRGYNCFKTLNVDIVIAVLDDGMQMICASILHRLFGHEVVHHCLDTSAHLRYFDDLRPVLQDHIAWKLPLESLPQPLHVMARTLPISISNAAFSSATFIKRYLTGYCCSETHLGRPLLQESTMLANRRPISGFF